MLGGVLAVLGRVRAVLGGVLAVLDRIWSMLSRVLAVLGGVWAVLGGGWGSAQNIASLEATGQGRHHFLNSATLVSARTTGGSHWTVASLVVATARSARSWHLSVSCPAVCSS